VFRVLLERLIVNRPHPWGLLITFIELIKVGRPPPSPPQFNMRKKSEIAGEKNHFYDVPNFQWTVF
jgi:hypothetical protein